MAGLVGSGCFRASRRVFCGPKCPAYVRYTVHTHLPLKKAPQIRWFRSTNKNRFACVTPQRHQRPQLRLLRPRNPPHSDRRASCALARAMSALNPPMSIPSTPNFQHACIARRCCSTAAATAAAATAAAAAAAAPPPPRRDVSTMELASAAVGVARRPGRGARERHVRSGEKTGATAERPPKARPRPRTPRTHRSDTLPAPRVPHRA